jgi:hypothetical protein
VEPRLRHLADARTCSTLDFTQLPDENGGEVSSALVRVLLPRGDAVYNTRNVNQTVLVENEGRLN